MAPDVDRVADGENHRQDCGQPQRPPIPVTCQIQIGYHDQHRDQEQLGTRRAEAARQFGARAGLQEQSTKTKLAGEGLGKKQRGKRTQEGQSRDARQLGQAIYGSSLRAYVPEHGGDD